jgi:hypothetical protein
MIAAVSQFVKETLPDYLKSLPIPVTVDGYLALSTSDVSVPRYLPIHFVTNVFGSTKFEQCGGD